jgi:alpha-D-xyloside xylohydrolase
MGDWSFDESKWPDPKAMVDECKSYGMEIMVSVWPFTCPKSRSYDTLTDPKNNWVTTYVSDDGKRTLLPIETHGKSCRLVDASNPDFRKYAWSLIESGYYQYGIRIFWLDASEPEGFGTQALNASWSVGNMRDQGSMFQLYWSQTFYDGLRSHGETDIMMLPRAGWVGTWRHGAVLWSGDIGSTMPVLKSQLNIGLSAQMSGVPWWTTDVGGYHGGNAEDPTYRETIVRWFQYGMTCPIFRQHGARDHTAIWFYGAEDEQILGDIIKLRASMKPYFKAQLDMLNATGRPFNRPLMWDFPDDPKT